MNGIHNPGFVAAALLCVSFGVAAQQPAPLNLKQKIKKVNAVHQPKEIYSDCKPYIEKEFTAYTTRVTRGLAAGVISPTERADLEKEYNTLKAKETVALKDGKVDPKECAALYDDLTDLNNHLGDALCSREVPAAKQAEVVAAIKQGVQSRVGNTPVTPNPSLGLCVAEITHMVSLFEASIQRGKAAGLIDLKEAADLEKSRAKLAADEKKAVSDQKISKAELKKMMEDIDAENKKLDAAMATPAAAAKARPAVANAPLNLKQKPKSVNTALKPKEIHGDCKAVMDKEFKAYTDRVARGLAASVITATERADLEQEYNSLKAKETTALKDGKIDPKECAGLYDDLTDLNNHLGDALCSREVPAAKQAEVVAAIKQGVQSRVGNTPVTPNPSLGLCVAEITHMVSLFEAAIQRGKAAGLIDAKEAADLEKGRAKLAADEKRAVTDQKISKVELKKMMDDIDAENKKLDAAMSSPAAAAKAKPAGANAPVVSWVQGVQPNAVVGGTFAGAPIHVCRAPMPNKEIHTGKEWKGTCYVEYGGKELTIPLAGAEVLVITIPTAWVAAANGQVPPTALQSGVSGGAPMHVCRAKAPDGQTHPGKAWKGNCYIGYGGKGIKAPVFDVLTPATPGGQKTL